MVVKLAMKGLMLAVPTAMLVVLMVVTMGVMLMDA